MLPWLLCTLIPLATSIAVENTTGTIGMSIKLVPVVMATLCQWVEQAPDFYKGVPHMSSVVTFDENMIRSRGTPYHLLSIV